MSSSEATTLGVRVLAESRFSAEHSQPGQWFFLYTITISNEGPETVQLISRHWIIRDASGKVEEVSGPGVVGEQPVLENGDSYVDPQLWSIDFTYVRMIVDGDQLVSDPTAGPNQGTIAALPEIPDLIVNTPETEPLDLVDYLGGHDSSFILALDHRGFSEVSGFGWLNHSPGGLDNHISASDWLFTVVPEPGSLAWLGLGLVFLTRALRRPSLARGGRVRSLPGP